MYGCLTMKEEIGITLSGSEIYLQLRWADGMIGAMPVFQTKEQALDYVDGDITKVFPLKEDNK